MGLDMYLRAGVNVYGHREGGGEGERHALLREVATKVGIPLFDANLDSIYIKAEIGYWRKDNQIHKWFVDNCQDGVDDCREAGVEREQLFALRQLCKDVLEDPKKKGPELLPAMPGFFFGRYEYDESYVEGLKETIKICDRALESPEHVSFVYQSSW